MIPSKVNKILLIQSLIFASVFLFLHSTNVVAGLGPQKSSPQVTSFKNLPSGAASAILQTMQKELPESYQLKKKDKGFTMAYLSKYYVNFPAGNTFYEPFGSYTYYVRCVR